MNAQLADAVLECRGVTVRVPGRQLVRELHAVIRPGRVLALLGRNGAGKSSLLHVLAGLAAPAEGEVLFGTRPVAAWPRRDLARDAQGGAAQRIADRLDTASLGERLRHGAGVLRPCGTPCR